MLADLSSLPLPDLAAYILAGGIPLALSVLAWPLLRPRLDVKNAGAVITAMLPALLPSHGLAGQWLARSRQLEAGFERQRAAMQLHRTAARHIGALDYEIDRLWRDNRAVMGAR